MRGARDRVGLPLPVYTTRPEHARMLDACEHPRDRLLLDLFWHTGCRVSEGIAARAGDLTQRGINLRNLKRGPGAEKHVPLPAAFLGPLRASVAGLPPTWPLVGRLDDPARPISRVQAWRIVTRAATAAGVFKRHRIDEPLRPAWCHCSRHGLAVNLLMQGVPITAVQRLLGHASLSNTQRYAQIADPDLERALAGVEF